MHHPSVHAPMHT